MNNSARQGLATGLNQRLTLAPGLTESLRLLSLPGIELAREVDSALAENIMLEREDPPDTLDPLPDIDWLDTQSAGLSVGPTQAIEDMQSSEEDLRAHLIAQLPLEHFSARDHLIAETIIDALDEDGCLRTPDATLLDALDELDPVVSAAELDMVICRIQHLEPTGVAARSCAECLLLQLAELPDQTAARACAQTLLSEHFQALGGGRTKTLARLAGVRPDEAHAALALIQTLDPHPGYRYSTERIEYLVPELLALREASGWRVELSPTLTPHLRVNPAYVRHLAERRHDGEAKILNAQAQAAQTFISHLAGRQETLLRVGTALVRHQGAFLDSGPTRLAPLALRDIAAELGLHESTISRAVQGKSIATPRGTLPLRHFFSATVSNVTSNGGTSSRAVQAHIKALIAEENPAAPLSDAALVTALAVRDIYVARRTVAKHREALGLASTRERRHPGRA